MSGERMLLAITVDVDPARDEEFNRWYDEVHVPEIVACEGIHAAWRLRSDDLEQSPRYVTCYLVDGPEVLETPQLREVRGWGPFEDEVRNYRRLWFRHVGGSGEEGAAWPIPRPSFSLEPARTALVLVDMQDAQCRPDRGLGKMVAATPGANEYFFGRIEAVIAAQQRLLEKFRRAGRPVVFLTIGPHSRDGSDLPAWKRRRNEEIVRRAGVKYAGRGDADHAILAELAPRDDEVVLNKSTFGGFAGTGLDLLLDGWGVTQLVVCGQATNVCVYMTAAEAADRGYESVVVGDACAAWSERLHDAFVENFGLLFGRTADSDEVIAELTAADNGRAPR